MSDSAEAGSSSPASLPANATVAGPVLTKMASQTAHNSGNSSTDFLLSVPPPVLHLLARSAPFLRACTQVTLALTWQHPNRWASWLVLSSWWMICLFGPQIARYGANLVVLAVLGVGWILRRSSTDAKGLDTALSKHSSTSPPTIDFEQSYKKTMTPSRLHTLIDDAGQLADALHVLSVQLFIPIQRLFNWTEPTNNALLISYLITSYPGYIIFTYYLGVRYILLLLGTVALVWNAPWFSHVRRGVMQSLTLRTHFRLAASIILGGGRDSLLYASRSTKLRGLLLKDARSTSTVPHLSLQTDLQTSAPSDLTKSESPVKASFQGMGAHIGSDSNVMFTFTVFENQRWWVGLDWTQALLPSERPPWCDHSLHAIPPPSAFTLPSPQVTFIPAPTKSDPDAQIKRISQWQWVDPDWYVRPDSHSKVPVDASSAATADLSNVNGASTSNASGSLSASTGTVPEPGSRIGGITPPSASAFTDWARNKAVQASHNVRKGSDASSNSPTKTSFGNLKRTSWMNHSDDDSSAVVLPAQTGDNAILRAAAVQDDFNQEWQADSLGWQYGDNSWEKMGPKGGMGKYTRRRAWLRRAKVAEFTEKVNGSDYKDSLRWRLATTAESKED